MPLLYVTDQETGKNVGIKISSEGALEDAGDIKEIRQTPTISANSIYTSGDAVGGLLTFDGAARVARGSGKLTMVVVIDNDLELAPLDLVLFDRPFTATADNAKFDPTDVDLANCIGRIPVAVSDYLGFNDNAMAVVLGKELPYVTSGTALYGQMFTSGSPLYAATDDLTIKITCLRN